MSGSLPAACYCPDSIRYYIDDDGLDQSVSHAHCARCDDPVHQFDGRSLLCPVCYRARDRDWRRWRQAHPEEVRLLLDGRSCDECGEPADQIDHIVPRVAGGLNQLSNLRPICGRCNASKGGKWDAPLLVH